MNITQIYAFFDLSVLLNFSWLRNKVFLPQLLLATKKKKKQRLWAQTTKDIPLSDFKLHRASEGTVVRTWPVSSVEDLDSTVGTVCDSNEFITSRR